MKVSVTKLLIQLIIFFIIAVIVFILSISVYSLRYWPDVYNYINANITIKRIPTVTELNITYVYEDTTDGTTTDFDMDFTTDDTNDYFSLDDIEKRNKRSVEIEDVTTVKYDYISDVIMSIEIIKDLLDENKLTTNMADVEIISGNTEAKESLINFNESCPTGTTDDVTAVFSWIAAIFIKNGTNQFQYFCDGAVMSTSTIITSSRCVNSTLPEDIIVILGKTSLVDMKESEKFIKISDIILHENFTETTNDLALLKTEEDIIPSESISVACISTEEEFTDAMTTGWAASGDLTHINFNKDMSQQCADLCGVYDNDVTVCPSYGGIYAVKQNGWYLHGIRRGDPNNRGLCINEPVYYTPLGSYKNWINDY